MSGLGDIKQTAKDWLADVLDNLSSMVKVGDEPTMDLEIMGAVLEIRLKPTEVTAEQLKENLNQPAT